ncbi:hypothetical protein [uncultured Merdimonas sp.]|uniref:hypothetical protein n=1 Tax=uncultured Merdimonas sp. TaxID=2023269 RepID=UPI00320A8EDA
MDRLVNLKLQELRKEYEAYRGYLKETYGWKNKTIDDTGLLLLALSNSIRHYRIKNQKSRERQERKNSDCKDRNGTGA